MKPIFPYFGGKALIAERIWKHLGNVDMYFEPFFGSGAVLLARPDSHQWWNRHEIVNDIDGYVANFWRAVQRAPDEVAQHAAIPAYENELHARKAVLLERAEALKERLEGDPRYYDAELAGWWLYTVKLDLIPNTLIDSIATSAWGIEVDAEGYRRLVKRNGKENGSGQIGLSRRIIRLEMALFLTQYKDELIRQTPTEDAEYILEHNHEIYEAALRRLMRRVYNRLARVRVACGDWTRLFPDFLISQRGKPSKIMGIFFDPPYTTKEYDRQYYMQQEGVAEAVREWCLQYGHLPYLRIVLCGFAGEHDELLEHGWRCWTWRPNGGYRNKSGSENVKREAVWYSPACFSGAQPSLLADEEALDAPELVEEHDDAACATLE